MLFRKTRGDAGPDPQPPPAGWDAETSSPLPGGGRTIIGPQTRIRGTIRGEGSILVRGAIEGEVLIKGVLTVATGATLDADIEAESVDLAGEVRGSLRAATRVAVAATGEFEGDMTTPILDARPGSIIRGRARVAGAEPHRPLSH
jgi:cytoskeletal protein CcmA (bactofilin family)